MSPEAPRLRWPCTKTQHDGNHGGQSSDEGGGFITSQRTNNEASTQPTEVRGSKKARTDEDGVSTLTRAASRQQAHVVCRYRRADEDATKQRRDRTDQQSDRAEAKDESRAPDRNPDQCGRDPA